ncbi:hypothetical protein D9619_003276 [Psilocybe cf. subviscida]|uniref:Rad21/Rec8-like protein N-terminal domain-containing protein n=1 Tax=Psilocybe cf. subviscida TaxID=2480587 RepID=A0A8H5EU45_9AGAR|nr:hypothetical protein D9619_003276 [Psilocybe cf. subviscida]
MFFTPELLAKRDSGFGLLWLAATLGSRSNFKKLPRRSVLTADIGQLCELISEPAEPLALRLSSNLMFGVVRATHLSWPVVKQEIFMTDVTNCVVSLKKVINDTRTASAAGGQIQMANPTVRPAALTIAADPKAALSLDYDAFVADWDYYLDISIEHGRNAGVPLDNDEDFNDKSKGKRKGRGGAPLASQTEAVRKEMHTLEEHHEHLLSASFEQSCHAGDAGVDISSSQAEPLFENSFAFSDGLELGEGIGDELARELGWGSPVKTPRINKERDPHDGNFNFQQDDNLFDMDFNFNAVADDAPQVGETPPARDEQQNGEPSQFEGLLHGPTECYREPYEFVFTSAAFSGHGTRKVQSKKLKRTRLLLDARTELTDEELKIARAKYLEWQNKLRREMNAKQLQKDHDRIIDDMICGVPHGIQAPGLVNFWQGAFKVQIDARSGAVDIHPEDEEPVSKRRKRNTRDEEQEVEIDHDLNAPGMGWDDGQWGAGDQYGEMGMIVDEEFGGVRQSSEEPGQARRVSRSASILGAGFELAPRDPANASQKSSLFPWDHAGPSSSGGNEPFGGMDPPIETVSVRLRTRSLSRAGSSPLAPSKRGSATGVIFSPAAPGIDDDFIFDVENGGLAEGTQQETQKSDINLVTLERNSFNFLEYARMQQQTLPKSAELTFDTVVPKVSSTRHVAASAFYHCLVLATKNFLSLHQEEPYEFITIEII